MIDDDYGGDVGVKTHTGGPGSTRFEVGGYHYFSTSLPIYFIFPAALSSLPRKENIDMSCR